MAQYPLDSSAYQLLHEVGAGVSAVVYKAVCVPMNSSVVAIKAIDLDQSRADFDILRRETKALSLLSHPNILTAHCSFAAGRRLWVVMPFMSAGSLQSIISSAFPDGLPETCIAFVLKETLNALSYLHNQGHLHRDIKAGNILVDSDGSVKLADFGVSASIYDPGSSKGIGSGPTMLTDVAGTPYWMAPEVIHSHTGYSFKADIWSFGITALELAHGRPPLSHLPPSKSLLMKITKRFRFSDYELGKSDENKRFSRAFKDMVGSCLDQDPSKRPTAEKLLKHSFFKNCSKGHEFLVKNVLSVLPSVEERFKEIKILYKVEGGDDVEEDESQSSQSSKERRISGWNFNEDGLELDPVFPTESKGEPGPSEVREEDDSPEPVLEINPREELSEQGPALPSRPRDQSELDLSSPTYPEDDFVVKQVRFGGETIIQGLGETSEMGELGEFEDSGAVGEEEARGLVAGVGESGELDESSPVVEEETQAQAQEREGAQSEEGSGHMNMNVVGIGENVDRELVLEGLIELRRSLDDQRQQVTALIGAFGGEMAIEDLMAQTIQRLKYELETERQRNYELELELDILKLNVSGASTSGTNPHD